MGKKPVRKPQKKLPQSVFLEVDGHGKPESPDGIILPTAPSSKVLADQLNPAYDDGSQPGCNNYARDRRMPTSPPYTAFIGNLSSTVSTNDIIAMFKDFDVKNIRIPSSDGKSKGFGYMELPDVESLIKCLDYNGELLHGKSIRVDVATPQKTPQKGLHGNNDSDNYGSIGGYSSSRLSELSSEAENWRRSSDSKMQDQSLSMHSMSQRSGTMGWNRSVNLDDVSTFRSNIGEQTSAVRSSPQLSTQGLVREESKIEQKKPKQDPFAGAPPRQDPFAGAPPRDEHTLAKNRITQRSLNKNIEPKKEYKDPYFGTPRNKSFQEDNTGEDSCPQADKLSDDLKDIPCDQSPIHLQGQEDRVENTMSS